MSRRVARPRPSQAHVHPSRTLLTRLCRLYPELSRERLLALVVAGRVRLNGAVERNPGRVVDADATVTTDALTAGSPQFASRAGRKLDAALALWAVECTGKVVLDAGASTGGFTDCLLHRGCRRVYAVDVGYNQLAYRLRNDARVVVMERINIRDVRTLDPPADFAVADLSFRSLRGIAAHIVSLTREARVIALLKPQFEVGQATPGFAGVVDGALRAQVLAQVTADLLLEGVAVAAVMDSPIAGRRGNREYLVDLRKRGS